MNWIKLKVIKGHNMPKMDTGFGKCDPLYRIYINLGDEPTQDDFMSTIMLKEMMQNSDLIEVYSSTTVKQAYNPSWEDEWHPWIPFRMDTKIVIGFFTYDARRVREKRYEMIGYVDVHDLVRGTFGQPGEYSSVLKLVKGVKPRAKHKLPLIDFVVEDIIPLSSPIHKYIKSMKEYGVKCTSKGKKFKFGQHSETDFRLKLGVLIDFHLEKRIDRRYVREVGLFKMRIVDLEKVYIGLMSSSLMTITSYDMKQCLFLSGTNLYDVYNASLLLARNTPSSIPIHLTVRDIISSVGEFWNDTDNLIPTEEGNSFFFDISGKALLRINLPLDDESELTNTISIYSLRENIYVRWTTHDQYSFNQTYPADIEIHINNKQVYMRSISGYKDNSYIPKILSYNHPPQSIVEKISNLELEIITIGTLHTTPLPSYFPQLELFSQNLDRSTFSL